MSKFLSTKPHRIEFEDGEWVELCGGLPYNVVDQIIGGINQSEPLKSSVELLKQAIKAWNFKDEEGNEIPVTNEMIEKLDTKVILKLSEEAMVLYLPSKKN